MQVEDFRNSPIGRLERIAGTDMRLRQPYSHFAFVPAPLPSSVHLSAATYKLLSEADRALGVLHASVNQLPNPHLLVRPSLTREAVSTSALEGTYAPYAEVLEAQYEDGKEPTAEVREVQNYVRAAHRGLELIKTYPIILKVVSELQSILVRKTRGDAYDAGRLRERIVCIGDKGRGIEQSRFVPPPNGDILVQGVSDWEKWINSDQEMPVLVKVALGHYQFETLHPFSDGNGRIGRLVITLQLIEEGVLEYPVLNLSPWLEPRREDYIDHLLDVSRTGDFDPWVRFFAEAVKARAMAATDTINRLLGFSYEVSEAMKDAGARGAVHDLTINLIGYPLMTIPAVAADLGVTYPTARSAISKLEEAGFLREITGKNYGRVYICDRVYDELAKS
ncbi:Fic family protein [Saccharomonospora amisosensis]|uniref:Fic family protein n=1 Tax=Saccharomonospora amisosensis TaxID=1128677 RepID=A0A7X5UUR5_9PSEU|nr:Fic/DOC family N-terminal domain-containing protein [Saccharomonospora amisosensis]NIJ14629.1 Fic family protein [Saccharomonospora amisosensis]